MTEPETCQECGAAIRTCQCGRWHHVEVPEVPHFPSRREETA